MGLYITQILVVDSENARILKQSGNGPLWLSKVIDLGTNRKRVCNLGLLSAINSNRGSVLPCFRDMAVFSAKTATHPYSTRILGCSFGLDRRCWGPEERRPKLIMRVITFELTQLIWPQITNVIDGSTDKSTIAVPRSALPALRGKNLLKNSK